MILVTGAGGNVGRSLIEELASAGMPARAAYHSADKAAQAKPRARRMSCAKAAGVGRIVKLSVFEAAEEEFGFALTGPRSFSYREAARTIRAG